MNTYRRINNSIIIIAVAAPGIVSRCANYEVNSTRGNIPGYYIRTEMQAADRAIEAARQAGKDKSCPDEFKTAESAKNNAYDVFRACHTEEGAALAKQATEKANALCPPVQVVIVPPQSPVAPTADLYITPSSITKGDSAKMNWSSRNADECTIKPDVGKVNLQGSMMISPAENTAYTIVCTGAGGRADSGANIAVAAPQVSVQAPAPVVETVQPKAAPAKTCAPMAINVQFDTNKADIKAKYHDEIKKLADFLKEFPKASGVIEGHTDSVGSKESNIKLSQRRADSVRGYLIKNFGIVPERLGAKGFGPTRPIADNKTSEGKQKNRRIEANFNCKGDSQVVPAVWTQKIMRKEVDYGRR